MIPLKPFLVLMLCCGILSACQPPVIPEQQLLQSTTRHVILSSHQRFSEQTGQLQGLATRFCANLSMEELELLRQHWRDAMSVWQGVKLINFGPILVDNQSWKIQFWPDKKNLIRRKALDLLNGEEPLNLQRVEQASVVVQGLSALEYLLFDDDAGRLELYRDDRLAARRCQLLQAVSQHTHAVASGLLDAWQQDYQTLFTQPGPDNYDYPDFAAALSALLDALVAAVEMARHDQLGHPLGHGLRGQVPRPYLAEAWRSRYSSGALHANLAAARALFVSGENLGGENLGGESYGMDDYLVHLGQQALSDKLVAQFDEAVRLSGAAPVMFDSVTDKAARAPLEQLYQVVGELLPTLKRELPAALGISLGFNANDGD